MADPILPDFFRAQAIFQGSSGLAEDRFVNTFVFRNDQEVGTSTMWDRVYAALEDFYFEIPPGATAPLWSFFGDNFISAFEVRVYDLAEATPRTPHVVERTAALPNNTPISLPFEVAACLSLRTSLRTARGRGRIYLGPLNAGALVEDAVAGPILGQTFRDTAVAAAERLRQGNGQEITWHVLSQADATPRGVVGGYVDDAFDTQRRRGQKPSVRTTFWTVL